MKCKQCEASSESGAVAVAVSVAVAVMILMKDRGQILLGNTNSSLQRGVNPNETAIPDSVELKGGATGVFARFRVS
eukprot:3619758-Rhodomonas_salina.1